MESVGQNQDEIVAAVQVLSAAIDRQNGAAAAERGGGGGKRRKRKVNDHPVPRHEKAKKMSVSS